MLNNNKRSGKEHSKSKGGKAGKIVRQGVHSMNTVVSDSGKFLSKTLNGKKSNGKRKKDRTQSSIGTTDMEEEEEDDFEDFRSDFNQGNNSGDFDDFQEVKGYYGSIPAASAQSSYHESLSHMSDSPVDSHRGDDAIYAMPCQQPTSDQLLEQNKPKKKKVAKNERCTCLTSLVSPHRREKCLLSFLVEFDKSSPSPVFPIVQEAVVSGVHDLISTCIGVGNTEVKITPEDSLSSPSVAPDIEIDALPEIPEYGSDPVPVIPTTGHDKSTTLEIDSFPEIPEHDQKVSSKRTKSRSSNPSPSAAPSPRSSFSVTTNQEMAIGIAVAVVTVVALATFVLTRPK